MPIKSYQRQQIVRLARLHRRGLLTEAEYARQKAQLLSHADTFGADETTDNALNKKQFLLYALSGLILLMGIAYSVNSKKAKIAFAGKEGILRNNANFKAIPLTNPPAELDQKEVKVIVNKSQK